MNDFRDFSKAYNNYLEHGLPYAEDYLSHHGILGMHWGIRRYQNTDGSLTEAGKARYDQQQKKDFLKAVNGYNKAPSFYDKNDPARQKLFNDEFINRQAPKIEEAGIARDRAVEETAKVRIKEYKDFLGATDLIHNQSHINNFDVKHYNKNVQKYYKLIDQHAKDQGWKNIQEKAKSQGLGNVDDLFSVIYRRTKACQEAEEQYRNANAEYIKQVTSLAEDMLKEAGVKNPTKQQIQTTIYGLSYAYKNH